MGASRKGVSLPDNVSIKSPRGRFRTQSRTQLLGESGPDRIAPLIVWASQTP